MLMLLPNSHETSPTVADVLQVLHEDILNARVALLIGTKSTSPESDCSFMQSPSRALLLCLVEQATAVRSQLQCWMATTESESGPVVLKTLRPCSRGWWVCLAATEVGDAIETILADVAKTL